LPDKQVSVDLNATDQNYLDEGDIVLARTGASVGKSYRYRKEDGKLVFAGFLIRVKPDPMLLISTYLANFLTTDHFWKWVAVTSARSGQPGINSTEYSSLAIPLPPNFPEQQKIADCLSSLDELITAQAQKLDALKAHKKGLMQQLFPAEGETVPKLRFPEFRDAGEWVPKTIGSVCNTYSGGTPATTQKEFYGGDIPFIRSAEIGKEIKELFLTPEGLSNSAAKLVAKGDVLVALYGANSGDVALAKIAGAINQAILCLKSEDSNAYIYQYLSYIKNWIISTYIQGGQGNLSGEIVKSVELCFPTPAEQQKIADCLASLDDLIAAQTQKLDALKVHKKGLMQQLFPSMQAEV
jgi:type I restriction enzyme S subunit